MNVKTNVKKFLKERKKAENIDDYTKVIELGEQLKKEKIKKEKIKKEYKQEIKLSLIIAYNDRGIAYLQLKDYKKAIKDFGAAISLDRNHPIAHNNRGIAYSDQKKYKEAIRNYNTAIEINSNIADFYKNLGNAYFNQGEYIDAIKSYNEAIKLNDKDATLHYNLGNAYLAQKRPKDGNDKSTKDAIDKSTKDAIDKPTKDAIDSFKKAVKLVERDIDEDSSTESNKAKEFILTRKELYLTAQLKDFKDENNTLFTRNLNDTNLKLLLELLQEVKNIKKYHEIGDGKELILAHYTSLETVHKLLPRTKKEEGTKKEEETKKEEGTKKEETKKEETKKEESRFRLNDARGMNDPEEGKRLINEVEGLKDFYDETEQEPNSHTFIASFLKEKEKGKETKEHKSALLMWITYGKDARGAKLTFPIQNSHRNYSTDSEITKDSKTTISSSSLPTAIYKVKYGTLEEENKKEISKILKELETKLKSIKKESKTRFDAIKEYVRNIIDEIRFLYKNEDYKFEEEYRIVWVVSNIDPRVKVSEGNNNLYIEVENNNFLFNNKDSTVLIGTAVPRKELVRDVIKVNLRDMGYKDCKVKTSTIEYIPSSK